MMGKKYLNTTSFVIGTLCIALSLGSCKEKGVIVDLGNGVTPSDTSYMGSVESPQQRTVLIEEFTGVSCPPCPLGHQLMASIVAANPAGRIAVVGIQTFGFIQAYPVVESGDTLTQHDNRTDAGTTLSTSIYGKLGLTPTAGVDRITVNSSLYLDKAKWATEVSNRLTQPTNANVTVTSDYNALIKQAVIKVKVAYTSAVSQKQVLTVAVVEDDVIDAQENGLEIDTFYHHEHVLRDILTSPVGSTILSTYAVKPAGIVYERTFVYDMSSKDLWNKDHCKVIAYVSSSEPGDKVVQQAASVNLK